MLSILAQFVRKDILNNLKKTKYFSLLCDETRDCGKDEQLSICVRYVVEGTVYEDFYNFVRAEGLDALSIMVKLKGVLEGMEVDPVSHLVAQCYDGASVMSGRLSGLQALMRNEVCPKGIYVHCWAHRLNLVLVTAISSIKKASIFLKNMSFIHSFFSASVPHDYFVKAEMELGEYGKEQGKAMQQNELKSISKTRWCCQAEACDAVLATLGAILKSIEHFEEGDSVDRTISAQALDRIFDSEFIICLVLFQIILRKSSIVANYLQSKDMDVSRSVELIKALKHDLLKTTLFDEVWNQAQEVIARFEIELPLEHCLRMCRQDADERVWTKLEYKNKFFDLIIEVFNAELDRRFSENVCSILNSISALSPTSSKF